MPGAQMRSAAALSGRFQKREQRVVRLGAAERRTHRQDFCQRLFFHGEIRVQIQIPGLYALSCPSQPQRNDGDVDARLKQGHGCAMSNDVPRNAFLLNGSGSSRIPGNAIARSGCLLWVLDGEREFQDGRTRCRQYMGMHGGVCSWASAKVGRGVPYALHPLPRELNYVPGNLLLITSGDGVTLDQRKSGDERGSEQADRPTRAL
jgi:hypothetical protein